MAQLDYKKIDAVLKKDPDISFKEFQEKSGVKLSPWSFHNRKRVLAGLSPYNDLRKKRKAKTPKKIMKKKVLKRAKKSTKRKGINRNINSNNGVTINVAQLIDEHVPTSNRKAEYQQLAKRIIKNPDVSYVSLKSKGQVNFSDANFYQLRRKIRDMLGLSNVAQSPVSPRKAAAPSKKSSGVFINIFEKELNGRGAVGKEAKDLLTEVFEVLNQQKIANLQLVEVISPRKVLEIRSFAKV